MIETERLLIRPLTRADAPFILSLVTQASWLRFIGDKGVHDVESAERYLLEGPLAMEARHGFALRLVQLKGPGTPIGLCGILKRDSLSDPDLGFALLDGYAGQGYAFEAASATMTHAREALGPVRLLAIAMPNNVRSLVLLERLGFRAAGAIDNGALWLFTT
ncbi:MAG: GNAT family N-acetyltransferase [Acidobacteriota bacterium]|nr:GNAT family N-acetyltransferase [Acidobacteriota bacterium]